MMLAKDFRNLAWSRLSGKWKNPVLVTLIYLAIAMGVSSVTAVGWIAAIIISGPLAIGYYAVALKIFADEPIELPMLFDGFKNFTNSFFLYFTNQLFVFLWSLLLIVPGIVKQYAYSMSYYIMIENPGMSPTEARLQSQIMMQGNKWRLFCLDFSFLGWIILSGLTLGILTLWIMPYMETAHAAFYNEIKNGTFYKVDIDE